MLSESETIQNLMQVRSRIAAAAWLLTRDYHASEDCFQNVVLKAMTKEVSHTQMDKGKKVRIITPTATIEAIDSTFNVRVTDTETALWVHRGQATVRQTKDGQSATLQAGIELTMSLENSGALSIKPQSPPTHRWSLQWPLDRFRALYPQLNDKSSGLQLIDVYALTVQDDVGLEILGVELISPESN